MLKSLTFLVCKVHMTSLVLSLINKSIDYLQTQYNTSYASIFILPMRYAENYLNQSLRRGNGPVLLDASFRTLR